MPAVCASASGTISMLGSAAIAVAKLKEERSFRREIMTASFAGLPTFKKSIRFAAFSLIYVMDARIATVCLPFGATFTLGVYRDTDHLTFISAVDSDQANFSRRSRNVSNTKATSVAFQFATAGGLP
ncbi:hypothetical protein [Bradyrhizobium sp. 1(2017)]|uniref:hypothetical protein n=1 Tax=Bradyrhizobium sp. 1(2017) TaxID=1404888 RepID=UPI00140EC9BC|nr:hypothetical protein [Bradyrhizobium sp. 1(2017)]QIO34002.1 hypothetical protein HAP40_20495 [Bradyrhizobium sp. 1(2017)]